MHKTEVEEKLVTARISLLLKKPFFGNMATRLILKEIPEAEVTRMEFDMKDQMIRQTILTTQSDIEEMKKTLEKIEDKIYNR